MTTKTNTNTNTKLAKQINQLKSIGQEKLAINKAHDSLRNDVYTHMLDIGISTYTTNKGITAKIESRLYSSSANLLELVNTLLPNVTVDETLEHILSKITVSKSTLNELSVPVHIQDKILVQNYSKEHVYI